MLEKKPETEEDIEKLVYFTKRKIDAGSVFVYVYRQKCPKCKKSLMGKPKNEKGEVKIRAKEYVCDSCGYAVEKKKYEEELKTNIIYECPKCKYHGEIQIPFKRKKIKGVDALKFNCEKCGFEFIVTKKMKELKDNKKEIPEEF
ncbi:MAG: hypothetical protein QXG86_02935 [Candidatus Woesearchaeota archaeon]